MKSTAKQNKTILITKSEDEIKHEIPKVISEKFNFIFMPTIITKRKQLSCDELKFICDYQNYDWIIFSSVNAVKYFFDIIKIDEFKNIDIKVAAVGEKTKQKLQKLEINVNLTPNNFSQEGLIDEFKKMNLVNQKVIIPTSAQSRPKLKEELEKLNFEVKKISTYQTSTNLELRNSKLIHILRVEKPDYFLFTSPSNFYGFLELLNLQNIPEYFEGSKIIPIGHVTAESIKRENLEAEIISNKYTINAILEKLSVLN